MPQYRDELEEHWARERWARIGPGDKRVRRPGRKRGILLVLGLTGILMVLIAVAFVQGSKSNGKSVLLPTPTETPTLSPIPTQTRAPVATVPTPTRQLTQTPSPTPKVTLAPSPSPTQTRAPVATVPTPILQPTQTPPPTPKTTLAPTPSPTPTPAPKLQDLVQYMLDLINKDRRDNGLSPVTLGNNTAAQKHAEERLANDHGSHWGMDGMKPYMRYTVAGGYNYEAENGFVTRTTWIGGKDPFYKRDPKEMLVEAEKSLMGSLGHRRTILDKWYKKVNIGIAYNKESLHLVQQFEGEYIEFSTFPTVSGGVLSMAGKVTGGVFRSVDIYYDPLPQPLIKEQVEAPPYDYSYGLGNSAGSIIPPAPPGSFYPYLPSNSVQASRWDASPGGSFLIEGNISSLLGRGRGVYTVVIWGKMTDELVPLTKYSIFVR